MTLDWSDLQLILHLLIQNEEKGEYYGNKDNFTKRQNKLIQEISEEIERREDCV